jgi:prevent-host-death family protein
MAQKELPMETFTVRDLRERTGDLIRGAEAGQLAVVTKHGRPVFVAVPFDDAPSPVSDRFSGPNSHRD